MRFIQQRAVSRSASGLLCLRLAGSRGEQLLLSFSPIPKLPRVYPSVSVLPVFEKSTPDAPFFFGGGFLAAATMPVMSGALFPSHFVFAVLRVFYKPLLASL